MSGPRVSTGPDSKQDYSTPPDFIAAVEKRFGPITFDLAAHAENAKHARYFAPREFVTVTGSKKAGDYVETRTPNVDPNAAAFDSLAQNWRALLTGGVLWLNPEFADIAPWAEKSAAETRAHAGHTEVTMLVPAAVGSNWYRDHVAPFADVYLLNGRLCFDGKNLFPKDCLLAHYHGSKGRVRIWDWRKDVLHGSWDHESIGSDYFELAIRLAWNLVADDAECTCVPGDECPLCHAKRALGRDMPTNEPRRRGAR